MKFCSFVTKSKKKSWGVMGDNGKVLDLSHKAPNLLSFLQSVNWDQQLDGIKNSLGSADLPLDSLNLVACLPNPPSMRDGYAFRQHVEAARRNRGVPMIPEFDEFPVFYYTNHTAVIGQGPCFVQSLAMEQLDFELEAAIVVGKAGINLKAENADSHIFGYTIMNDFSARKLQMEEMKMSLGPAKGKDFATALGPWLVTPDELDSHKIVSVSGNRYNLEMTCEINSLPISKGNMKDMNWSFAQILERVSYGTWIYPGDVIGSGTVGTGCFMELNGSGITKQWLKPGDKIVLKISGLGELHNSIVEGSPPQKLEW